MSEKFTVKHGQRDDPLRPSVFDPADVEVVGFMDTTPPAPPSPGAFARLPRDLFDKIFSQEIEMWEDRAKRWGDRNEELFGHRHCNKQCDHCGAHIRWAYVIHYKPTDQHFIVGEICGDERMQLPNRQAFDLRAERKRAESRKVRMGILIAKAQWAEKFPEEFRFLADYPDRWDFMGELCEKLNRYGALSEKQTACVTREIAKVKKRDERAAAEALALEGVPGIIQGRHEVTGEVVYVKQTEGAWGPVTKMMLKDLLGRKYWCSVPKGIETADLKGKTVCVMARWDPKPDNPHFAWGSRPTKR